MPNYRRIHRIVADLRVKVECSHIPPVRTPCCGLMAVDSSHLNADPRAGGCSIVSHIGQCTASRLPDYRGPPLVIVVAVKIKACQILAARTPLVRVMASLISNRSPLTIYPSCYKWRRRHRDRHRGSGRSAWAGGGHDVGGSRGRAYLPAAWSTDAAHPLIDGG